MLPSSVTDHSIDFEALMIDDFVDHRQRTYPKHMDEIREIGIDRAKLFNLTSMPRPGLACLQ